VASSPAVSTYAPEARGKGPVALNRSDVAGGPPTSVTDVDPVAGATVNVAVPVVYTAGLAIGGLLATTSQQ
jgi:hypothetical protein